MNQGWFRNPAININKKDKILILLTTICSDFPFLSGFPIVGLAKLPD